MKKSGLYFAVPMLLAMGACSDKENNEPNPDIPENPGEGNEENPGSDTEAEAIDLSAVEMANCYIVQTPGRYKLKADNQFNLGEGLPKPRKINPVGAKLLWQTVAGSVKDITFDDSGDTPYIEFEITEARGSALIAAVSEDGRVAWSWHIWMPEIEVKGVASDSGYEVMNLNLGALNNQAGDAGSYGMLYQWGRKDPFPAAATLLGDTYTLSAPMYDIDGLEVKLSYSSWTNSEANTMENAIANPMMVMSNSAHYSSSRDWLAPGEGNDALWGNPRGWFRNDATNTYPYSGEKTCYDPSPAGWRVAPVDAFMNFTSTGGYTWDFGDFNVTDINGDGVIDLQDYNYGWFFNLNSSNSLYFPAAARFDGSYAMLMGSMSGLWGNYWSNAPYPSISGGAQCALAFQVKNMSGSTEISISPAAGGSRADAYSIRCVRDNVKK